MTQNTKLPEGHMEFAAELGALCKKHGIEKFFGQFDVRDTETDSGLWGDVKFQWDRGRHGDGEGQVHMATLKRINVSINPSE